MLLALFLLLVSALALASGARSLHLDMLPWSGRHPAWSCSPLLSSGWPQCCLAITRSVPVPFFLWSLVVAAMLLRGYVFSSFSLCRRRGRAHRHIPGAWLVASASRRLFGLRLPKPARVILNSSR